MYPPRISRKTEARHLRSASSPAMREEWFNTLRQIRHNSDNHYAYPESTRWVRLSFASGSSGQHLNSPPGFQWKRYLDYTSYNPRPPQINFSVALYSAKPQTSRFLHPNNGDCLLRGVYRTKCTPVPLTILYIGFEATCWAF